MCSNTFFFVHLRAKIHLSARPKAVGGFIFETAVLIYLFPLWYISMSKNRLNRSSLPISVTAFLCEKMLKWTRLCVHTLVQDQHEHAFSAFNAPFAKQRPFPRKNYLLSLWSGNRFVVTAHSLENLPLRVKVRNKRHLLKLVNSKGRPRNP